MRIRTRMLSFLLILALCTAALISSALADVKSVKELGDGSVKVKFDSNDDEKLILVYKTGDSFEDDMSDYGYIWLDTDEKKSMTVYDMAPGQSYWVLTENSGSGFTKPYAYEAKRPKNFNMWNTPPKFAIFELKKRDSSGKITDPASFRSTDLEDLDSYDSYGFRYYVTWPDQRQARDFLWQFVFELPDGYRYVFYHELVTLPRGGGYWWGDEYIPIEDFFHTIYNMRGEVPRGEYKYSLYWNGEHVSTQTFRVR